MRRDHHRRDPYRQAVFQTVFHFPEPLREGSGIRRRAGVPPRQHPVAHFLRDRTGDHQRGAGLRPLRDDHRHPLRAAVLQDRETVPDALWRDGDERAYRMMADSKNFDIPRKSGSQIGFRIFSAGFGPAALRAGQVTHSCSAAECIIRHSLPRDGDPYLSCTIW